MYAIKIVIYYGEDQRQRIELLSADELTYEIIVYKGDGEYAPTIRKLLGEGNNEFTYHGDDKKGEDKTFQLLYLRLLLNSNWKNHAITNACVYIMLNGKTIDKLHID